MPKTLGLIGRKIGMTSLYDDKGKNIPCTIIEAGPCIVTQVKTEEKDGYNAIQLGFGEKKEKKCTRPLLGHFKKNNIPPKTKLVEFRGKYNYKVGDIITVKIFEEDRWLDITGTTKGKGFQGVVKRHGFAGVGESTHGTHKKQRHPGSIGASSFPSRVFKGQNMAGHMGTKKIKIFNYEKFKIIPEKNLLIVKGSVPGYNGSYLIINK